jgi:Cu/Ag efflux protein CusF
MTRTGYKLTDEKMQTYCGYQWELQEWKETSGEGELCSPGWLHYYSDPLLAAFLNPIHANFAAPRLFQVEVAGKVKEEHGLKLGCTKMRLVKELEMPAVTMEQRVKFGILCALEVYKEPQFVAWAANWLDGTDRSKEATAATAADAWAPARAAAWAAVAARAAARAADAYAANAAAWAPARAAEIKDIDLVAIAKKAME